MLLSFRWDGTFNDVTCSVATQVRPILGYIPSGTVNDIAKLKNPKNIKSLKNNFDGHTVYHDVGRINGTYFMYVAAIGILLVQVTEQNKV